VEISFDIDFIYIKIKIKTKISLIKVLWKFWKYDQLLTNWTSVVIVFSILFYINAQNGIQTNGAYFLTCQIEINL